MDFWIYEFLIFAFLIITNDTKFVDSLHNNCGRIILFLVPVYFIIGFSMNKWFINDISNKISSNIVDGVVLALSTIFS